MGTSWLRVAILPEDSPYGGLRLRGAYTLTVAFIEEEGIQVTNGGLKLVLH
jgi:hypothetical protein